MSKHMLESLNLSTLHDKVIGGVEASYATLFSFEIYTKFPGGLT
jgi:hypothetical protein